MNDASADGLAQESVSGTSSLGRPLILNFQINPPYVFSETNQTRSLYIELKDPDKNVAIPHTTYEIWLSKVNAVSGVEVSILHDRFHSHNGPITITSSSEYESNQGNGLAKIVGEKDATLDAWIAGVNNTIETTTPILHDAGLYHIKVQILGTDADSLNQSPPSEFNSWLSLGYALNSRVPFQDQTFNVTITSYYDKVINYSFDERVKTISWSTPFFWNLTQINAGNTIVHEEVKVPKLLIEALNVSSFSGSVNGQKLNSAGMLIDSYTFSNATVIHYIVNKRTLLELAGNTTNYTNQQENAATLSFALLFNEPLQLASFNGVGTETTNRHASVWIGFTPSQLASDPHTDLRFQFYKIEKGNQVPIVGDVHYNLKIFRTNGTQLLVANDLIARNATDERILNFPGNNNFRVTVEINGVDTKLGHDVNSNGIAISEIAVPEFSPSNLNHIILVMGWLILPVTILLRVLRQSNSNKPTSLQQ